MAQYDVARKVFESNEPVSVNDLKRKLNITGGTIRENLNYLKNKGIVEKENNRYYISSKTNESDIEDLKPTRLKDIE